MQNSRVLTVAESVRSQPKITLTGAWLRDCGFSIGDTVTVTCSEPGILVVQSNLPTPVMAGLIREKKQDLQHLAAEPGFHYKAGRSIIHDHQSEIQQPPVEQDHQGEQQPVQRQVPGPTAGTI